MRVLSLMARHLVLTAESAEEAAESRGDYIVPLVFAVSTGLRTGFQYFATPMPPFFAAKQFTILEILTVLKLIV